MTEPRDPIVQGILDILIRLRQPLDEMRTSLLAGGVPDVLLDRAIEEYRRLTGNRRWMTPPPMLVENRSNGRNWYPGADQIGDARFWPMLRAYLLEEKGWSTLAVDSVHQASDKIVAWLEAPSAANIRTRGLVIGYIQSGKTANFTAVMAKAADAGYRFFIVLSGTKTNLRKQTYDRLDIELVQRNSTYWFNLLNDRNFNALGNADYFLSSAGEEQRVLHVVKKHGVVLEKLLNWLRSASPELLRQTPFLIIDDEADEASINTARNQAKADPERYGRTATNRRLVELLRALPKAAYIGYTATPFANILIDPRLEDDLYPQDFIVTLPKPPDHFGPERIFGRERLVDDNTDEEFAGIDMVRIVSDSEIAQLRPPTPNSGSFVPVITTSLQSALHYFWMATATRIARGQGNKHSTMLVHTTQQVDVHAAFTSRIRQYRQAFQSQLNGSDREVLLSDLRQQWETEQGRVDATEFSQKPVAFAELLPYLEDVVAHTREVTDNSRSQERLSYDEGSPRIQIAVGGNTLSRGLTLEGLLVSFFVRAAGAYDTLLQMGRWFGYRREYADLPRIWMTGDLYNNFRELATVEEELRRDIERYAREFVTPHQFGPRIRVSQSLSITAPLKMQHAVRAQVSYGGDAGGESQTVLFEHRDREWLERNIAATDQFIQSLLNQGLQPEQSRGHVILRDVAALDVISFIECYQFHSSSRALSSNLLKLYIRDQNTSNALHTWNVIVRGVRGDRLQRGEITLGGLQVPLLERSRRTTPNEYAHIGVLMSRGDIGADLQRLDAETKNASSQSLREMRQQDIPSKGLLLIYPISKDSQPAGTKKREEKVALDAMAHVIGLGFVFPPAVGESFGAQTYVTVDPSKLDRDEFELDEEEEV